MVSVGQLDPAPDVHPIMKDYQWTAMPHPLGPARTRNAGCKQTNKTNEEQNDSTIRERTRGEPKINSEWPNVIPFFSRFHFGTALRSSSESCPLLDALELFTATWKMDNHFYLCV